MIEHIKPKIVIFVYPSFLTFVLGAQKNSLIETVLLSTHNISFIKKRIFFITLSYLEACNRKPTPMVLLT